MTSRKLHGPYRHGRKWRVQVREEGKQQRYQAFSNYSDAVDFMSAGSANLKSLSEGLLRRADTAVSTRGGWVYAIATAPESARRLKVGFTNDLKRRFNEHRTTNPTAVLVAAWEANPTDELAAHRVLAGRIGVSEVFVVPNLHDALKKMGRKLGARLKPMSGENGRTSGRVGRGFAIARQPSPVPNGSTPIADLVMADVRARQELGQRRYGVDLQANNGRDALVDAYQEAIDLAMYLRQLLEERQKESP